MGIVEDFATTLDGADTTIVQDVEAYIQWQVGRQTAVFTPSALDNADMRTYLLHLKLEGYDPQRVQQKITALKQFYAWVTATGLLETDPFTAYDFKRPFLTPAEIQNRRHSHAEDPQQREIERLRAFNELAQALNRMVDIHTVLETAIHTITNVMNLATGWIFLLPDIYEQIADFYDTPPHDFSLAAACGLPPGLQMQDNFYLCQPPDCSCQKKLRRGQMKRAVNIVECTRLQDATKAGGDSRGLAFHASAPLLAGDNVLGLINVATEEWQLFSSADLQFLSVVGSQVAIALERARLFDLAESQRVRLERELKMAHQVQASLLPDEMPLIAGYSVAAHWQAAREMAGDFYDVIPLQNGRFALIMADVSDKGAPAALYMAMVHSLLRTHCHRFTSPALILQHINEHLMEQDSSDMFVTMFCGLLDPETRQLTYASAGQDPPILHRATGEVELLMPTGPLIGVLEEIQLTEQVIELSQGDCLLAYTDGVTDALNAELAEYGRQRLLTCLQDAPCDTAVSNLAYVLADLTSFIGTHPQFDDITMLSLVVLD